MSNEQITIEKVKEFRSNLLNTLRNGGQVVVDPYFLLQLLDFVINYNDKVTASLALPKHLNRSELDEILAELRR